MTGRKISRSSVAETKVRAQRGNRRMSSGDFKKKEYRASVRLIGRNRAVTQSGSKVLFLLGPLIVRRSLVKMNVSYKQCQDYLKSDLRHVFVIPSVTDTTQEPINSTTWQVVKSRNIYYEDGRSSTGSDALRVSLILKHM